MVLRGKQEVVLKRVMSEGVEKILVVVGTGRGKSLMWLMPCLMGKGGGVTVVVVPLKSLMDGVKEDCEKMGLACLVWNDEDGDIRSRRRRMMFEVRVIVIAPEGVNGVEFGEFLDDLEIRGGLDRVVIDECHCVLSVFDGWRIGMLNLREMVKRDVGVLFLTATLPDRSLGGWLEVVGLRRNDLVVVRDVTVRPELRYGVMEWRDKRDRDGKLEGLVKRGRERLGK